MHLFPANWADAGRTAGQEFGRYGAARGKVTDLGVQAQPPDGIPDHQPGRSIRPV
ncbi:hypothetical protein GCM10010278_71830 [Streptomyces melanogenes]|nr:hypothetical protein GCM10010278_71830 [Streptomyces melanogenes]